VHNAPGDDIAVVMCGYEEQIKKMLLDQNPGLQRRFPIASAFQFEDFSDAELRQIMVREERKVAIALIQSTYEHKGSLTKGLFHFHLHRLILNFYFLQLIH
jgi:hypothetical protein